MAAVQDVVSFRVGTSSVLLIVVSKPISIVCFSLTVQHVESETRLAEEVPRLRFAFGADRGGEGHEAVGRSEGMHLAVQLRDLLRSGTSSGPPLCHASRAAPELRR